MGLGGSHSHTAPTRVGQRQRQPAGPHRVDLPYVVLLEHLPGVHGMPDVLEALCGISTSLLEQDLFSPRMLEEKTEGQQRARCKKRHHACQQPSFQPLPFRTEASNPYHHKTSQRSYCPASPSGDHREQRALPSLEDTVSETPPKEVKPWHRQKHSFGPTALPRSPNGFGQGNHTKERTFSHGFSRALPHTSGSPAC